MEYAERKADAQKLFAMPSGADLPLQKFKRGCWVKVGGTKYSRFKLGFEGIVEYTHGQKFGSDDDCSYSVIVLGEYGEPVNSFAWYDESELSLISDDVEAGLEIIDRYRKR